MMNAIDLQYLSNIHKTTSSEQVHQNSTDQNPVDLETLLSGLNSIPRHCSDNVASPPSFVQIDPAKPAAIATPNCVEPKPLRAETVDSVLLEVEAPQFHKTSQYKLSGYLARNNKFVNKVVCVVHGPSACGKTHMVRRCCATEGYLYNNVSILDCADEAFLITLLSGTGFTNNVVNVIDVDEHHTGIVKNIQTYIERLIPKFQHKKKKSGRRQLTSLRLTPLVLMTTNAKSGPVKTLMRKSYVSGLRLNPLSRSQRKQIAQHVVARCPHLLNWTPDIERLTSKFENMHNLLSAVRYPATCQEEKHQNALTSNELLNCFRTIDACSDIDLYERSTYNDMLAFADTMYKSNYGIELQRRVVTKQVTDYSLRRGHRFVRGPYTSSKKPIFASGKDDEVRYTIQMSRHNESYNVMQRLGRHSCEFGSDYLKSVGVEEMRATFLRL